MNTTLLFRPLLLTSALMLATPALADNWISVYQQGVQGDATANEQAIEKLTTASAAAPDNLQLQAMLGAVETAAAKHALLPWNKMKAAEQGLSKLDKTLRQLNPQDRTQAAVTMQVHTIAGCTFINLPDLFNRFNEGYALLKNQIEGPAFAYAPQGAKQALYSCGAKAASKAGDEALAKTWQQQSAQ
ncbi:hypothetical protein [Rheinheimera texasensis]|jgi:hypothetical protein|uniref:hypothetical protein n=1 Tax=Rheinheimera texasensis TaxID=306205 RepID=UPI0004E19D54|nr:hypothetical protein [Rheinheimera texasensis]